MILISFCISGNPLCRVAKLPYASFLNSPFTGIYCTKVCMRFAPVSITASTMAFHVPSVVIPISFFLFLFCSHILRNTCSAFSSTNPLDIGWYFRCFFRNCSLVMKSNSFCFLYSRYAFHFFSFSRSLTLVCFVLLLILFNFCLEQPIIGFLFPIF